MCRDQRRPTAHEFLDGFHYCRFGGRIEGRRWFVEQQNWCIFQKRTRNADALPLTDAQMAASFANKTCIPVRQLPNEIVRLRATRCSDNFFFGSFWTAIGDV